MITAVICLGSDNIRIFCDFIVLSHSLKFVLVRVESGSDDPDYLGHSDHFFGGSSGSHPQTNLSGCDPDFK